MIIDSSLQERLKGSSAVLAPGVYDALSALIAHQAGFKTVYLSGASVAYTLLGRSDVGLTTSKEVADVLANITDRVTCDVIVDADTGFGNALNVQRTVRMFESAGAAMVQLEDQTFPKRCGHLDGKRVINTGEMCGKLKAALDARTSSRTLIMARTDALGVEGLESAMDRADAYLECGADVLFIEAPRTTGEMDAICRRFASRVPLLANMTEGGKTPVEDLQSLERRGFRLVIYPGGTVRFLAAGLTKYYGSLHKHQTTTPLRSDMLDLAGLNALLGTPELLAMGQKYES